MWHGPGSPETPACVQGTATTVGWSRRRQRTPRTRASMVDESQVKKALRKVKDPELNLDLVVLGLVYGVDVNGDHVHVRMSLTTPMCPAADQIGMDAKREVESLEGVDLVDVELTFDPPWSPERMDPLIRASLGL